MSLINKALLVSILVSLYVTIYSLPLSDVATNEVIDEDQDISNERLNAVKRELDHWRYYGSIGKRNSNLQDIRSLYEKSMKAKPHFTNLDEEEQYVRGILQLIAKLKAQALLTSQYGDDKPEFMNLKAKLMQL